MLRNLYLAYAATWIVLGGYIVYLLRKHLRVTKERQRHSK